jgi:hypothetical protein
MRSVGEYEYRGDEEAQYADRQAGLSRAEDERYTREIAADQNSGPAIRMSTHQLAARIEQMEATQQTRDERPAQARNRAAKLARYRDELALRTANHEQAVHDAARQAEPPARPEIEDLAEALVRRYGCGTALDAIWEASHRLFAAGEGKAS